MTKCLYLLAIFLICRQIDLSATAKSGAPCSLILCMEGYTCVEKNGVGSCVTNTVCKEKNCNKDCKHGFKLEANGCPTCACEKDPCLSVSCPLGQECRNGQCKAICIARGCLEPQCPYGLAVDENGCPTCECLDVCKDFTCDPGYQCYPVPVQCVQAPCPPLPQCMRCPAIQCEFQCPLGYKYNKYGCQTCDCEEISSNPGSCPEAIGFGICIHACSGDDECEANKKCCFNGCGFSCQDSIQN